MKAGVMTAEKKREELRRQGVSIRAYAKKCKVDEKMAYRLLAGYLKGNFGESHKAAVKLGLKEAA